MGKKKIIIIVAMVTVLGTVIFVACTKKQGSPQGGQEEEKSQKSKISYYTCPMHPQVHEDHPGECPICHMRLVPVYKDGQNGSDHAPMGTTPSGPSVMISPDRQQMIGIKTVAAMKKPAVKEIRTVGRVAFDPDLAVAQQEYLEISKNVPSLRDAAKSKLRIMGMSDEEIRALKKQRRLSSNLYLPKEKDSVWIYATLYQDEMNLIPNGTKAIISLPSGSSQTFEGTVKAVDSVVNPMTRSVRARIEVPKAGGLLKPDTYVNVVIQTDLGEALTIPKSAVIDTGTRKVAFVVHDDRSFQSRDIKTGADVGDDVVVIDGISEGEKVVASGAFLVDSESSLKAAVSQTSGQLSAPTCPAGQKWDTGMSMCM